MKAIIVKARFHWGFSVRKPAQSAAQETFLYPPPSTLIGALARGYSCLKNFGEEVKIRDEVYSSVVSILGKVFFATIAIHDAVIPHQDLNKNLVGVYMRVIHRRDPINWFGVQAMGKSLCINGKCTILYFLKSDDRELALSSWGITYLGSKEGLISVEDVDYTGVDLLSDGGLETEFYVKEETCILKPIGPGALVLDFWDYTDLNSYKLGGKASFKLERYYAPNKPLRDKILIESITNRGLAVRVGEYTTVIPKT